MPRVAAGAYKVNANVIMTEVRSQFAAREEDSSPGIW